MFSADLIFHWVPATVQKEHRNGHPFEVYNIVNGLPAGAVTKYGSREGKKSYAGMGRES